MRQTVLIKINKNHLEQIFAHARRAFPQECCGLLGGRANAAISVYPLMNVAENPLTEYEAAPADLFAAQRAMRERREKLVAIYHSHPQQTNPAPSATDVRRAFYRDAVYFIVGCAGKDYVLRGFRLYESESFWEPAEFVVTE